MAVQGEAGYAGDLPATEAYRLLVSNPTTVLIDVRTQEEWTYVGTPSAETQSRNILFIEWQSRPAMNVDPHFVERLSAMLEAAGIARGSNLFFLCRSGARSREAAIAMTRAGWPECFNVVDGFEGPLDASRHRGAKGGWKAAGLPWTQT